MFAWVDKAIGCLENSIEIVLVTVADVKGSAPRETGAKMLVAADRQWLTIGGGNLEWQALAKARSYLNKASAGSHIGIESTATEAIVSKPDLWFDVFQLGPSLGQCCGGVVGLLFELLTPADLPWLKFLRSSINSQARISKKVTLNNKSDKQDQQHEIVLQQCTGKGCEDGTDEVVGISMNPAAGQLIFTDYISPPSKNIYVFGAGHVGQALVHLLATLPCKVTWVDSREYQFPENIPANVLVENTDIPEAVIEEAVANSCYIVMTHDHALDQKLCEQILRRDDVLYFGLIGSLTKRRKFEHRFKAKGISPERYEKMVCPIGISGIDGKQPAVIALAVAAQLMSIQS